MLVGLLAGCGADAPAQRPASALDQSATGPAPVVQRLRVIALADGRYRAIPQFEDRIRERLAGASDHMAAHFGLPLDLIGVEPWTAEVPDNDAERLLADLEATPSALRADVDLVVGFTARPPPRRAGIRDVGRARYAGRALVARSLTPFFGVQQPEALHEAEVFSILHGLGTVLGALPSCGPRVMADRPLFRVDTDGGASWAVTGWSPLNQALVRAHARLPLRPSSGPRVPPNIAEAALQITRRAEPPERRCAGDTLDLREALLAEAAERAQTAAAPTSPPSRRDPLPPAVTEGLAALASDDPTRALRLCGPLAAERPETDASRCAGLAAEQLGDLPTAARYLRAWLSHQGEVQGPDPVRDPVLLALARAVGRAGDDAAARALLAGYVQRNPDDARAHLNLGIAAARMGDYTAARAAWEQARERSSAGDALRGDAERLLEQLPAD
jgi:tetratricopeptide (TPR) repeat protein